MSIKLIELLKSKLDAREAEVHAIANKAKTGNTNATQMNKSITTLHNNLKTDAGDITREIVSELKTVSNKIASDLSKQNTVLLNTKNGITSKAIEVNNEVLGIINGGNTLVDSKVKALEKTVNSTIEFTKKTESEFNQTLITAKNNLDAQISKMDQKYDNLNNNIDNFSSFDTILKNVGGVENLKKQLAGVRNVNDLKNVLKNISKDAKVDELIQSVKSFTDINAIQNDLINFAQDQKTLIENQIKGTISEAKAQINNIKSEIVNAVSETKAFLDSATSQFTEYSQDLAELTDGNLSSLGINTNLSDLITIDDDIKNLIDDNKNLLENIGISGDALDNISLTGDISTLTTMPTTVSADIPAVSGITSSENMPDLYDTPETTSAEIAYETSDSVSSGDTVVASFNGIKIQDGSSDSLGELRKTYWESQDKLNGFIAPWDGRLGTAYTNSQTVGNNMPYGEEWVGSPSLSNPYALIRFDQVAGKNHHKTLLDQRGSFEYRSSRIQPSVTLKSLEKEGYSYDTTQQGDKTVVIFDSKTASQLGVTSSDTVFQDESGALYIDEPDTGTEIWKPKKDGVTGTGKAVTEPSEVEVIKTTQGNIDAQVRQAEIQAASKGDVFDSAKTKSEIQSSINESNKKNGLKDTTIYTPNQNEYWYQKEGWVRCPENGGPYVPRNYCEGDKIKTGTVEEKNSEGQSEAEALKAEIKRVTEVVKIQTSRQWFFDSYATNKRYIRTPNSSPVSMKVVEPITSELVNTENWRGREQFVYQWSDFLYATEYGNIPNNYLITLRRFPVPVSDAAVVPKQEVNHQHILPVAKAVTWLGEETGNKISELLSFTTKINWTDMKSKVESETGNEQGSSNSPFGEGLAKWLGRIDAVAGGGKFGQVSGWDAERAKFDPYTDGDYAGRIYGPVNVIDSTKMRDRGIDFNHDIKLNFSYSLKSIGGVNPKAALLDIMANFLALTYNNAAFWGGANRYFPQKPQYPFLGGERGMKAWYKGDITGFVDGLADQLTSTMKDFGSMFMGLFTNPGEALKKLATGSAKLWMAEKSKDKRPGILAFKALLTGEPVGEWHLVIGNPFNPIAMIGNLICEDVSYSFGGGDERLGPDDFPETLNISVSLKHGRPRDKGDIESMFNRGQGRLHYSYYGKEEPWNSTQATKNVAIMKAATTYEDNFDGKTHSISGKLSQNDYKTLGQETGNLRTSTANVMGATSKQAYDLAAKVGYKSGS